MMLPFRPLVAKATVPLAGMPVQPTSRIVKQRRHHHTDADWEDQKRIIFRLYIAEDRNAEDVIEILARDFAFKASRRQIFKKFKKWKMEKNKKRHREEEGQDPGFGSSGRSVPEDTMSQFAKRHTTSAVAAVASSMPTPPSISYFTSVGDHDTTTLGQCIPQAPWGTPSVLSPTNLLYMHASPAIEHLEFSYNPLDMIDFKTPRLSPNCDVAPWLPQTSHFPRSPQPADPSTAAVVRTPSPTPFIMQLDNLPWFKFQVLFCTFLKEEGIDFCGHITSYDPSLDHPSNCSDIRRGVSIMDGLQLWLSMSEERINLRYLLDVLGEQRGSDLGFIDESEFGPILDVLTTSWTSDSPTLNTEENIRTLYSYFRPFVLERYDGELLEGAARILGPLYDGLLQFLNYTFNLLSNNLLSESDVDKIVQWIDETQGYELFAKLLSTKSSTIEALASNLLPSALRLKNVPFTRIILRAGVNPNSPMGYRNTSPLQYIAKHGDIELVRILLDAGADVNAPPTGSVEQDMHTALQAAAKSGNLELVQILLDVGADVNAPATIKDGCTNHGYTALQAAALTGNIELVQLLLNAGADVNAPPGNFGYTAIQAAAIGENIALFQTLLNVGADINAPPSPNGGSTALQAASKNENIELVQILLSSGADVNASPSRHRGHTALQAAAQAGNIELVRNLLDAGADVNTRGYIALRAAAKTGNIELAQLLLNAGAGVNASPSGGATITTRDGRLLDLDAGTALQVASFSGNIRMVQILLDAGADVNAPPPYLGCTALQAAAEKCNIKLIKILIDAGADINAPPSQFGGRTALQAAAMNGNIDLVQVLLDAGADINTHAARILGYTALQAAAINGNIELVQILLGASADINAPPSECEGYTALQAAAEIGNIDLVQVLVDAGADINAPPSRDKGCTALQMTAKNGNIKLVKILLSAGADINAPPSRSHGSTALQAAVVNGNIELVEILLNAGAEVNAPPSQEWGGKTALQAAAIRGQIRIAQLLLQAGADVNAAPAIQGGRTALEGAAEHGRLDLLQLLIDAGADMNRLQFIRALKFAVINGHAAVCRLLNRSQEGGWISPTEARQMKEPEDQFSI